jgi:uncharacterized membrane protein YraQ (UPF0718 family)
VIKITILLCTLIFIISYIQSYFPPERSKKIMTKFRGIGAHTAAALLGTVTPFCSCSSIPLFIGFTSAGLPVGVTFSFLISSPMVDLASLVLLTSIFGVKTAVIYVISGLIIAVAGGTLIQKLNMEQHVEDFIRKVPRQNAVQCCGPDLRPADTWPANDRGKCACSATQTADLEEPVLTARERISYAAQQMKETFAKVFPYVLAGVAVGAVIHNWLPEKWITAALGTENPFGVVLAVLAGVPMYADIFGTIPIAEALLGKGAQLGTILSFMMAVTTLSLPSLIMLRKAVKPQLLAVFTAICTAGIITTGYLFNAIQHLL